MPELPEVNVVAKQLRAILLNDNQRINQINLYYQKSLRNAEKIELENLKNLKPIDVFQIAKNLIIETENKYLILHLRMEGNFKFLNKEELTKIDLIHTIASFKLNNNN
jgi:formamidopyrimidine-DNA glycosylase